MKFLLCTLLIWASIVSISSLSYPFFESKRYQHMSPIQTRTAQHIPRRQTYEHGYLTNNGYYYYPHHEYRLYGMPTYHGEYKPKTYYYSSGPSYSYYNDRETVSNPLDDLHEEILQENEEERQNNPFANDDYDDDYYVEGSDNPSESYTSNFLRNMIDYNRQRERLQRLQQLQPQDLQPTPSNSVFEENEAYPKDNDYFTDFDINPDDYKYEPKGEDNFDLQKYWDAENSALGNSDSSSKNRHHDEKIEDMNLVPKYKANTVDNENNEKYYKDFKHQQNGQQSFHDDYRQMDYDDESWINWDRKRSPAASSNNKIVPNVIMQKRLETKNEHSSSRNHLSGNNDEVNKSSPPALGQKENYITGGTVTKDTTDPQNTINHSEAKNYKNSPNESIEKNIYNTIKQMIRIQQSLKQSGSKKRKRNLAYDANLVTELDNLRKIQN